MSRLIFECIDGHTCGNPVRLIKVGHPSLTGKSIAEKRTEFISKYDWIRTGLMFEPRGHDMMSGSFIFPPENEENDFAILFIETSGCLPMCGHGTIGTVTFALQEGLVKPKNPGVLKVEVPAGLIEIKYREEDGKIKEVSISNVESFLYQQGIEIETPSFGKIVLDISYGGNFYGIIEPQGKFLGIQNTSSLDLIKYSLEIREVINHNFRIVHPLDNRIHGLSHILWAEGPKNGSETYKNAVFYGDKAIDRSPCGTGTSARMAQLHVKGELGVNQEFFHYSIIGTKFKGRILGESMVGKFPSIRPEISGWAVITGYNNLIIDDQEDPLWKGFQVP